MRVPGGHEARATSAQGKLTRERDTQMNTVNEIKAASMRWRSRVEVTRGWTLGLPPRIARAAAAFEQNAATDVTYLLARIEELQAAIITAAAELSDAASDIAASYTADDEEAEEIRVIIGDPVAKLVTIAQTEEATK